jgi:DNA recombination protein RmuC
VTRHPGGGIPIDVVPPSYVDAVEFVVALLGILVLTLAVALARLARRDPPAADLPFDQLLQMQREILETERLRGSEELRGTETAISHQVGTMRDELVRLHRLVEEVERDRREHVGELTSQLRAAGRQTQVLTETTQSLREALSSTTARGQWGERMAEDVLRLAGFIDGVNYRKQQALAGSGGIPDYTFLLPQGLCLHMDVKFPLNNYMRFLDAESAVERERLRKEFLRDVRLRLKEVTRRDYIDTANDTVDCVLLFIPNEQVYGFIQEQDRTILDDALRNKVIFCSPLTLFAVLAVIRQAVDNFRLSQTSHEILGMLQGFEKQWDRFVEQMDKVGRNLKTAGNAFEELEGTRRRGVERELEKIDAVRRQQAADAPPAVPAGEANPAGDNVLPLALDA